MIAQRAGASVLLAGGLVLVFAGVASALAFSLPGMIASAAAIAAILYAGAVWFGGSARTDASVLLFTPLLTVAAGPLAGRAVGEFFPVAMRKAIDEHCRAAIAGQASRFSPAEGKTFEVAPVRAADGAIVYGILIASAPTVERAAAAG